MPGQGKVARVDPGRLSELTFGAVMAAWVGFGLAFALRPRAAGGPARRRDGMGLLGLVVQAVGYSVAWSAQRPRPSPFVDVAAGGLAAVYAVAVGVAFGSVLLTLWAVRSLGRQWALAARLVEGHQLVTGGPYRYVRNPIYTGMLGMLLATGVAVSRPWALAVAVAVFWAGTVVRVRAEERLLREAFGEAFTEWSRRTPALVPGIW